MSLHAVKTSLADARILLMKADIDEASSALTGFVVKSKETSDRSFTMTLGFHTDATKACVLHYLPQAEASGGFIQITIDDAIPDLAKQSILNWLFTVPKIGGWIRQSMQKDLNLAGAFVCRNYPEFYSLTYNSTIRDYTGTRDYPFIALIDYDDNSVRSIHLDEVLTLINKD